MVILRLVHLLLLLLLKNLHLPRAIVLNLLLVLQTVHVLIYHLILMVSGGISNSHLL
jgi:hypothetical protein